jgi:hypothetical protein
MHLIFHRVPAGLCRTNVTGSYVICYLIDILTHDDGGTVVTFVYVLVDIFDGLNRSTDLDIDMTVITCGQIGVIRDDIAIVKGLTSGIGIGPTIVGSGIFRITIFAEAGLRTEDLWKVLATLSIDHAGCGWEFRTARTVHHALSDSGIEGGMGNGIRDLSRDDGVDVSCITYFEGLPQKDEEMDVRQTTLLKLYGEDKALNIPKETFLYVFQHGLDLLGKDACHYVRTIRGGLTFPRLIGIVIIVIICEEIVIYLWPAGICGHGEEDVRFAAMASDGHRVLKELEHVTGAAGMGCG